MNYKSFSGDTVLKADDATGEVVAKFAELEVLDHDGDVTVPGAFKQGQLIRVSAYNHASWKGALPVGRGIIKEEGKFAVADMKFLLDTTQGRDTFNTVKGMGELMQWSYGFKILDSEPGEHDGKKARILKSLDVHEVSPVLLGAGIGTGTVSVKSFDDLTEEEIQEMADRVVKTWKDKGDLPQSVLDLVKELDELKAADEMLQTIAILNGIDSTKEIV